jgi:hypothetical protein
MGCIPLPFLIGVFAMLSYGYSLANADIPKWANVHSFLVREVFIWTFCKFTPTLFAGLISQFYACPSTIDKLHKSTLTPQKSVGVGVPA